MLVAELVSAGRGAAAQPAFEPGPRIPLAKGARDGAEVGDLVTVTMRGRAGRVTAVHGSARSPRAALRALLAANALGTPFPRAVLEEAEAQEEDAPPRRPRPSRPARPAGHHDRPRGRQGPRRRHRRHPGGRRRHPPVGPHRRRLAVRRGRRTARPRGGPARHVRLRARGGRPDASPAPVLGPLQPAARASTAPP